MTPADKLRLAGVTLSTIPRHRAGFSLDSKPAVDISFGLNKATVVRSVDMLACQCAFTGRSLEDSVLLDVRVRFPPVAPFTNIRLVQQTLHRPPCQNPRHGYV